MSFAIPLYPLKNKTNPVSAQFVRRPYFVISVSTTALNASKRHVKLALKLAASVFIQDCALIA